MPYRATTLGSNQMFDLSCLIIASGRGQRMGGPKALLDYHGRTFAEQHVRLRSVDCQQVVVVSRALVATRLKPMLEPTFPQARVVKSSAPGPWGPAGSIAAAVRAGLLTSNRWVLICPVDLIPTKASTVARLYHALTSSVAAVRPRFQGRGGHPVIVHTELVINAFLPFPPPTLRDVLRSSDPPCVDVDVTDENVRIDLDTPKEYQERMGHPLRFIS